jgi:hypothetical protein
MDESVAAWTSRVLIARNPPAGPRNRWTITLTITREEDRTFFSRAFLVRNPEVEYSPYEFPPEESTP